MTETTTLYTDILATVLQTPHRDVDRLLPTHNQWLNDAPRFYPYLAAWYFRNGDIRDQKELMIAVLCMSSEAWHRDVGCAMLGTLPPHQVERCLSLITRTREGGDKKFYSVPRSVKWEATNALKVWSSDSNRWDRAVLSSRKSLKKLAVGLRFNNGPIQTHLFDKNPPEGSLPWIVKKIAGMTDNPLGQAQLIVENNIPWPVASSIADMNSPVVLAALINAMTPQQLLNNLQALKNRGVMENTDLSKLVNSKLRAIKRSKKKINVGKTHVVTADASKIGAETAAIVNEVITDEVKKGYTITKSTGILIDASSSMDRSVEMGKRVLELLSISMKEDVPFYAYAFNAVAFPIAVKGTGLAAVKSAMRGIVARGATSVGAPLASMAKKNQSIEQLVIITDQDENRSPTFSNAYRLYQQSMNSSPSVIIVWLNGGYGTPKISNACDSLGVTCQTLDYRRGEAYNLNDLMTMLSFPGLNDLAQEILGVRLPTTGRMELD